MRRLRLLRLLKLPGPKATQLAFPEFRPAWAGVDGQGEEYAGELPLHQEQLSHVGAPSAFLSPCTLFKSMVIFPLFFPQLEGRGSSCGNRHCNMHILVSRASPAPFVPKGGG